MHEAEPIRVQRDPLEVCEMAQQRRADLRTPARPVHRIADDAQPERCEMHADLVGPPGRQRQVQTRGERAERLLHAVVGERPLAALDHRHAFSVLGMAPDRPVDRTARR